MDSNERLYTLASEYLAGRASFQELHALAADLLPALIGEDERATALAGAVLAAEAETVRADLTTRSSHLRTAVASALLMTRGVAIVNLTDTVSDTMNANKITFLDRVVQKVLVLAEPSGGAFVGTRYEVATA